MVVEPPPHHHFENPCRHQDNFLFSLLIKIDKPIQDAENKRQYFRDFSYHERATPLELHCQVIEAQSFEQARRMVDLNQETSPFAILTQQYLITSNTADFYYITQNQCNKLGVWTVQE